MILVIAEQRDGRLNRATWETIAGAQQLAGQTGAPIAVLVPGANAGGAAKELAAAQVREILTLEHAALEPYTPDGYTAALTIQSGINQLRYATLKGIMAAKKKEIRKMTPPVSSAPKQKIVSLYVPEKGKKTQLIGGSPAEAAKELVRRLREEARVIA